MRNMPIPMHVSPIVSGTRPPAHDTGHVVFSRNPYALPRLSAQLQQAVDAHRAQNRANDDWLKRDR